MCFTFSVGRYNLWLSAAVPFMALWRQVDSSGELVIRSAFQTDPPKYFLRAVDVGVCLVVAVPGKIVIF